MAAGHTPGPWHARGQHVNGPLDVSIAWCGESTVVGQKGCYSVGVSEAKANARLIADAPDMLAALERRDREIDRLHARVQELERERDNYKLAYDTWSAKTEWVQQTAQPRELGMHRADVLRERIDHAAADENEACIKAVQDEMERWRGEQDITDFRLAIAAIRARGAQGEME